MNKRVEGPEAIEAPAGPVLFALLHAASGLEERLERSLGQVGLSIAKYGVLLELDRNGEPLPLSELARRLSCVRSNITQLVDRLEDDGLVRRAPDPDDRRSIRAELTANGRTKQKAGAKQVQEAEREFASAVSRSDRAALHRALTALE